MERLFVLTISFICLHLTSGAHGAANDDLLRRVAALEQKQAEIDQTIRSQQILIQLQDEKFDAQIKEMQESLATCQTAAADLKKQRYDEQMLRKKRQFDGNVAFSVWLDHDMTLGSGQVIRFNKIITNEANGYDPNTGHFTCPEAGMYVFSFMVSQRGNYGELEAKLVKNGEHIIDGVAETAHDAQDLQGGNTVALRLQKGDTVAIEEVIGNHVEGWTGYRLTSFTGMFVYP
ncbi:complement C1q subcomponent subunit B-like [Mya arenaria]|uniref:complement C1q subcomponent subunit B-like n=1 Tax=Mya arenaria TaxID=6604 RepID=UPI0022DFF474|nr:complement C1q subcomponent subunit B-like [Mya arenaria]